MSLLFSQSTIRAKTELDTYQRRIDNAQTLMLDGKLDVGEYQKIKNKIEPEIERLAVRVSELSNGNTDERDIVEFGFYFLNNMIELFAEADLDRKRYMLGSTIREKVIFSKW
jgi:site-specific DNA recombinase